MTGLENDAALFAAVEWIDADTLEVMLRRLPMDKQRRLLQICGVRVDPKYARRGVGQILRPCLRTMPTNELVGAVCVPLTHPLRAAAAEHFGAEDRLLAPGPHAVAEVLREAGYSNVEIRLAFVVWSHSEDVETLVPFLLHDPELGASADAFNAAARQFRTRDPRVVASRTSAEAEDADGGPREADDAAQGHKSGDNPEGGAEESAALFTTLDELVIRTLVATYTDTIGAPDRHAVRQLVDEVLHLNASRHSSYHHLGLLSALDPSTAPPDPTGMNDERRRWFRFGFINGLVRQGDEERLAKGLLEHVDETTAVLTDRGMAPSILAPCLGALVERDAVLVATLLPNIPHGFARWPSTMRVIYNRGRALLGEDAIGDAQALFQSLLENVDACRLFGKPDLLRRVATCMRARTDYPNAQQVIALATTTAEEEDAPNEVRAVLAVERGLIEARMSHLRHVHFPDGGVGSAGTVDRLRRAADHFENAVRLDDTEPRANYCLGVLAYDDGDFERSARHLEIANSQMRRDPTFSQAGLVALTEFYGGLSLLQALRPGDDGPAYEKMRAGLEQGFVPSGTALADAIDALLVHQSHHAGDFIRLAVAHTTQPKDILGSVSAVARTGAPAAIDAAEALLGDRRVPAVDRLIVAIAGIEGATQAGFDDKASRIVELAAELVDESVSTALDEVWAGALAGSEWVRQVVGPFQADADRIELLRRSGDDATALVAAEALYHRVVGGQGQVYSAHSVLELIRELGADDGRVAHLEARLPTRDAITRPEASQPVRVVFVGGNEIQERWRDAINEQLTEEFGGLVTVDWHFPGWSSRWRPAADQALRDLDGAHALVLMQFVRTNMGRYMRREAGERNKPWIPCSGHGRDSMLYAIHDAVAVVAHLRAGQ